MRRTPQALEGALSQLRREHLWRVRQDVEALGTRTRVRVGGRLLVDFSSNDYLGLAHHPEVSAALREAADLGAGSAASHMISGHGPEHSRLEEDLARWTGRSRALLLSTGYMANLAALTTLAGRGERVLLDRLSHASLIDGARLSAARIQRYPHCDVAAVESALETSTGCAVLATDGVFSMDGDIAPVAELAVLARRHGAWLVVDDAHGLGVLGPTGGGVLEQAGLGEDEVPLLMGTLGKALGSFGAFLAGSEDLIELMIQRARSYIYTTALPAPMAVATRKALEIARSEGWRRERVLALTARLRAAVSDLPLVTSWTPIQPVVLGDNEAVMQVQARLHEEGFRVVGIRSPSVPKGSERLRITLSAAHTEEEVDALAGALRRACQGWLPGERMAGRRG